MKKRYNKMIKAMLIKQGVKQRMLKARAELEDADIDKIDSGTFKGMFKAIAGAKLEEDQLRYMTQANDSGFKRFYRRERRHHRTMFGSASYVKVVYRVPVELVRYIKPDSNLPEDAQEAIRESLAKPGWFSQGLTMVQGQAHASGGQRLRLLFRVSRRQAIHDHAWPYEEKIHIM